MSSKNSDTLTKKQKIQERISFFMNNKSSLNKKLHMGNNPKSNQEKIDNNIQNSIPIKKEIGKMAEPRFKISSFEKLLPKFYKSLDITSSLISNSYHEITNSEIEMLEIDEKLPQKKLDQIESRRLNKKITNTFPFHFLIEIEKCYQFKYNTK